MIELFFINALLLLAALLSSILPFTAFVRKAVPALSFLQIILIILVTRTLLSGTCESLVFTPDFSCDRLGVLFMLLNMLVCSLALAHCDLFFAKEEADARAYNAYHERIFYACASLFIASMNLVFLCDNLGILWVCVEATTLLSAALVYFSRSKHALEACWKYLIICSVGIAFALLGTVLIFASSQHGAVDGGTLNIRELVAKAALLKYPLLRMGFIFCLVGYGTKAGIFPLHSWLPDAHSEAPAPASAMLSGALLNCALYAIWRISKITGAAGHDLLAYSMPLVLGTVTVLAASFFLVHQHGIKRLWAYSSIENVGLMLVAIALNSGPLFFLQAFNHSIAKTGLFLLSGNIIQCTGTKKLSEIKGIFAVSPIWALLFASLAFAVTGAPPFGAFISEWLILTRSGDQKQYLVLAVLIFALALSFIAVSVHVAGILLGKARAESKVFKPIASSFVPALFLIIALAAGVTVLPSYLVDLK